MANQQLRRSQFILSYGPGAILEGPNGPRVIKTLEDSGVFSNRNPHDFEVPDLRLSRALLDAAGIVRVPSNQELGVPESKDIYETLRFPAWSLCVLHNILYRKHQPDLMACPMCPPRRNSDEAWQQANKEAIRFVAACDRGHLDDVNWPGLIHHTQPNCRPQYLRWQGTGALRNIEIVCPTCGGHVNLGFIYASDKLCCSGRFPELGRTTSPCSSHPKVIQRGAAILHIPEIVTALTIPPHCTALHRLLESGPIQIALETREHWTKALLMEALNRLVERDRINQATVWEIESYPEEQILEAIRDLTLDQMPQDAVALRLEEFRALQNAARYGAPRRTAPQTPSRPHQFEVDNAQVRIVTLGRQRIRITPVNRLRVVMAQIGYRRIDPQQGELVLRSFVDARGERWYPGVEVFGEGIFLDFEPCPGNNSRPSDLSGTASDAWFGAWIDQPELVQLHPVFVWWHTLSHRLIKALSVDSGYSSAAIRERLFVDVNPQSGDASGGVLLYTAQPGGDGTLGGLVAMVPHFDSILETACDIDVCSNDPLCADEVFGPGKCNGAACYVCLFASETSCEYRNMYLDRHVLMENRV